MTGGTPRSSEQPAAPGDETSLVLSDPARLGVLYATGLLDAATVNTFERVARLAARALGAPIAQVNLITDDAQVPKAAYVDASRREAGDPASWRAPVGLDRSYCQHVVATGDALLIEDARIHPLVRDNLATSEAGIVAYASVPVRAPGGAGGEAGAVLGTVCVVDFVPRDWTADDLEVLEDLAGGAAAEVARRLTVEQALASSEARYRALAHAIGEIVWTTAPDGQVEDMSEWRAYTGQTVAAVRGWGWLDAVHPDDRARTAVVWQKAVDAQTIYDTEYRIRGRDGTYRWFVARGVPVLSTEAGGIASSPRIREWVGCCTDIDDERRSTEELHVQKAAADRARFDAELARSRAEADRARAEAANRAKSEFLADHEPRAAHAAQRHRRLRGAARARAARAGHGGAARRTSRASAGRTSTCSRSSTTCSTSRGSIRARSTYEARRSGGRRARERGGAGDPQLATRGLASRGRGAATPVRLTSCAPTRRSSGRSCSTSSRTPSSSRRAAGARRLDRRRPAGIAIGVTDTGRGVPRDQLARIFDPFVQIDRHLTMVRSRASAWACRSAAISRGAWAAT